MSHDIFLSHSSKDKAAAVLFCEAMEAAGLRVWMAPRNLTDCESTWPAKLVQAIRDARALVLLLSNSANASHQVEREVGVADNAGIMIIPIRIEDVQGSDGLAFYLATAQWLDAFPARPGSQLSRTVKAVESRVRRAPSMSPGSRARQGAATEVTAGPRAASAVAAPSSRAGFAPLLLIALGGAATAAVVATLAYSDRTGYPASHGADSANSADRTITPRAVSSASCAPDARWRLRQAPGAGDIPGEAQVTSDGGFAVSGQSIDLADVSGIRRSAIGKVQGWFDVSGRNVQCHEIGSTHKYCCELGLVQRSDISSRLLSEGWANGIVQTATEKSVP